MHKKAIALLSAALLLASLLTACEKHSRYGKVIVDSRGMEHVVMTDKDGVTVCDANGNLIEIMTGSNKRPLPAVTANGTTAPQASKYQTNSITFPALIQKDNVIENPYCKLTVPEGWTSKDRSSIILTHDETGAQISVSDNTTLTASQFLEKAQADCEAIGVDCETGTVTLDDLPAHTLRYTVEGLQFRTYVITASEERIVSIVCTVEESAASQVDFDAVLQAIRIK